MSPTTRHKMLDLFQRGRPNLRDRCSGMGANRRARRDVSGSFPLSLLALLASTAPVATATRPARAAAPPPPYVATRILELTVSGDAPMRMPTDVTVGPAGGIYVVDGIHHRIVRFDSAGRTLDAITRVGDETLSSPIAATTDAEGRLWIADTGHHRVLVRGADGSLVRVLPVPRAAGEPPPDITDVAVSPDGATVWMVDNDNHRLIRVDLASGVQRQAGRLGESLGQLHHPFMLALGAAGTVHVTDVINGRIEAFSGRLAPLRTISGYGVELGQLYRPKGIACDTDGAIWVSDGTIGVIQVFTPDGSVIDVLRGSDGEPMQFESPMGIAFDADGHLYVAELRADRAVKLEIARGPRKTDTPPKRRTSITGGQARACTVCHLEWIEPFPRGIGTEIARPPETSEDDPAVSRSDVCLSCHDGSVVDSRHRVWEAHSHRRGVAPPEWMEIPPQLPLVDGKIACRTCHSAHTTGQVGADFRTAVFLRVENRAAELCMGCHPDKTRGPQLGTHPTGGMPWPVPQALIDAGAKIGPNPRELTCTVCHMPHGSAYDHLLVMGVESNQLCMTCHDQMRPGMFRDGDHTEHPLSPVVNAEQKATIHRLNTRLGPGDRLICLSCHRLHHGKGERFMLAEDLTDGAFCIGCHSEKSSVFGTSHDLRTDHPEEKNRLGMTPSSGGPCSACHLFHRYARPPEASALDPGGGKCITCHQPGRCAGEKSLGPVNHPQSRCVDCHDPHRLPETHYLRGRPADICAKCHGDYTALVGGPHDYRTGAIDWPAESVEQKDECLACHRPHGTQETGLFRMADVRGGADAGCRACHSDQVWGAAGTLAAVHPTTIKPGMAHDDLPLADGGSADAQLIGCRTCHNPHASRSANAHLLRIADGQSSADLCVKCHSNAMLIGRTAHGAQALTDAGFDAAACGPCHSVHADRSQLARKLLWPKSLAAARPVESPVATVPGPANPVNGYCVACHRLDGPAQPPAIASHPVVPAGAMRTLDRPGDLPLFDENGRRTGHGAIACLTCHLPHGRTPEGGGKDTAGEVADVSPGTARYARLLLRPFTPPNVCTTCHGADALRRFLYFHDPQRRSGPLVQPASGRGDLAAWQQPMDVSPPP